MKSYNIRIWPDIVDYRPSLIPLPNLNRIQNDVLLDFSSCEEVNSSGLCILLIQLLKMMKFNQEFNRIWQIDYPKIPFMKEQLNALGFISLLKSYYPNERLGFFDSKPFKTIDNIMNNINHNDIKSFPIYRFAFTKNQPRRRVISEFKEWLFSVFEEYRNKYLFHDKQLICILNEIAKNAADHTEEDAFFGLDIIQSLNGECLDILFSFGDLGIGIKNNVMSSLKGTDLEKRMPHMSLYEAYRIALTIGFSCKRNSAENKGMGMSIIREGANGINLKLLVFDANSMGILTDITELTHSEIRKNFINLGSDAGFYYLGKLKAGKI